MNPATVLNRPQTSTLCTPELQAMIEDLSLIGAWVAYPAFVLALVLAPVSLLLHSSIFWTITGTLLTLFVFRFMAAIVSFFFIRATCTRTVYRLFRRTLMDTLVIVISVYIYYGWVPIIALTIGAGIGTMLGFVAGVNDYWGFSAHRLGFNSAREQLGLKA